MARDFSAEILSPSSSHFSLMRSSACCVLLSLLPLPVTTRARAASSAGPTWASMEYIQHAVRPRCCVAATPFRSVQLLLHEGPVGVVRSSTATLMA
ncbi:hypothetical protein E2C01_084159 [Portunus trituberculatus]|uniref:Uncharacterized protein n=1 Tax=Portunus trituberculatus TaxID=210409 RepID=A0A5B7J431_PORTR|nr:hypothetical protein [Portunus trituberculatus]